MASRRSLLGRGRCSSRGRSESLRPARPAQPTVADAGGNAEGERTELWLYARHFHLHSPTHRAGQLPVKGDRHSAYGELLDRPGTARSSGISPPRISPTTRRSRRRRRASRSTRSIWTDGTIHGLGSALGGAHGHFVILGGTGRYTGVSGSYVAQTAPARARRQRHSRLPSETRDVGGRMAFDAFLKIEGIEGESTRQDPQGRDRDLVVQLGRDQYRHRRRAAAAAAPGRPSVQDFHFTMAMSKASPNLMLACATGKHYPEGDADVPQGRRLPGSSS